MAYVKKAAANKRVIYIGPNLKDHSLYSYQVFLDGVPTSLSARLQDSPNLTKLFVPVEGFEKAVASAKTAGTPLNMYYKEMEGK